MDRKMTVNELKKLLFGDTKRSEGRVMISSKTAGKILRYNNDNNRKVTRSRVEEYKVSIKCGLWKMSPTALSFNKEGTITNGQHRLIAIYESGASAVPMMVMFDVEHFPQMDQGKPRTYVDNSKIDFRLDADLKSECGDACLKTLKGMLQYVEGGNNKFIITDSQLIYLANHFKDKLIECYDAGLFNGKNYCSMLVRSAFLLARINWVDLELLAYIRQAIKCNDYHDGKYEFPCTTNLVLKISNYGTSLTDYQKFTATCHCIRKCVEGKKTRNLSVTDTSHNYSYPGIQELIDQLSVKEEGPDSVSIKEAALRREARNKKTGSDSKGDK